MSAQLFRYVLNRIRPEMTADPNITGEAVVAQPERLCLGRVQRENLYRNDAPSFSYPARPTKHF
jgi:hypothetical protein